MKQKIKVWDLPTRLFHWLLVACVFFMWFSADAGGNWLQWHLRCGLFVMVLVLFRITWGFVGSDTARFRQFVKGPQQIRRYLNNEITENEQPGHNPLGALMVLALLAAVLLQVISGLFASDENTYLYNGYLQHLINGAQGEVARFVHVNFFWLLLGLVGIHVLAVLLYRFIKKHDLIRPMITGFKTLDEPLPSLRSAAPIKAVVIVVLLTVAAYFISITAP